MAGGAWREIRPGYRALDLHGLDRASARRAVLEALESCRRAGVKRLRIVHGKGTGALRDEVRFLLEDHPAVADLRGAKPRDGGEGAVEVRLATGRGGGRPHGGSPGW